MLLIGFSCRVVNTAAFIHAVLPSDMKPVRSSSLVLVHSSIKFYPEVVVCCDVMEKTWLLSSLQSSVVKKFCADHASLKLRLQVLPFNLQIRVRVREFVAETPAAPGSSPFPAEERG